jgi:hypothetical protein
MITLRTGLITVLLEPADAANGCSVWYTTTPEDRGSAAAEALIVGRRPARPS